MDTFHAIIFVRIYHFAIFGISTTTSSWRKAGTDTEKGTQIDLVIDRADRVINLCEMKFAEMPAHPDFSVADLHRPARLHKQRQNQSSIYLTDSVEEERQVRDAMQFCPEALDARVQRLSRCVGDKGLVIVE